MPSQAITRAPAAVTAPAVAPRPELSRYFETLFAALGRGPDIEYVDMPAAIRGSYQYFTQASVDHLRQAGYRAPFTPIEAAVKTYVTAYLDRQDRYR